MFGFSLCTPTHCECDTKTRLKIRERVVCVDEAWLSFERLELLLACAPSDEDLEAVAPYDGDPDLLATCEHFFYTVQAAGQ